MRKLFIGMGVCSLFLIILSHLNFTQTFGPEEETQVGIPGTTVKYPGMVAADVDNDGIEELACDFGPQGIWLWDANYTSRWVKISANDPDFMIALEWDGDGEREVLIGQKDGSGGGFMELWDWQSGNQKGIWSSFLTGWDPYYFIAADVDLDGDDEVVVELERDGSGDYTLYLKDDVRGWNVLYAGDTDGSVAVAFSAADDEVVTAISGGGMKYWNFSSWLDTDFSDNWMDMTTGFAEMYDCLQGEIDGDAEEELVVDIGGDVWIYNFNSTPKWSKLNNNIVVDVRIADIAGDATQEIIFAFSGAGMWYYAWDAGWTKLSNMLGASDTPGWVIPFKSSAASVTDEFLADFNASGLWYFDSGTTPKWAKVTPSNAKTGVKCNWDGSTHDEAVIDFGAGGIWTFDNFQIPKWRKITSSTVELN